MIVALQKVKKTLSNSISEPSLNTAGRKGPPAPNTNGPEDACEPWEETQFQNIAALQQSGRDLIRSISSEIWEGFKGRVAPYIERIQFRREAPWTRPARTARVSI